VRGYKLAEGVCQVALDGESVEPGSNCPQGFQVILLSGLLEL